MKNAITSQHEVQCAATPSWVEQQTRGHHQRLTDPGDDDDLIGCTRDAVRSGKVVGDLPVQQVMAIVWKSEPVSTVLECSSTAVPHPKVTVGAKRIGKS